MALSSSGSISASQIANEYGYTTGNSTFSLGGYRTIAGGGNYPQQVGELSFSSIDGGGSVATGSNAITMGSFRGTRLQTVVNFWSAAAAGGVRLIARDRYNSNGSIGSDAHVATIGGHRTRPNNSSGTKVHIHVKRNIDNVSTQGQANSLHDQRTCAFRTGSWESGTQLQIDVANGGRIQGAGGWGGAGGSPRSGAGGNGGAGTSGLGVQYSGTVVNITGSGVISAGYGGGGGGGGAYDEDGSGLWGKSRRPASGGGGGGGAGRPGGAGNIPGSGGSGGANGGNAGNDGETFGEGGAGGNNGNEAIGGTGGDGGSRNELSDAGGNGSGNAGTGAGGGRGPTGAAIRRNSGISVTINDPTNSLNGRGSTTATGVQ
tara:strand:+ start:691 stop:1812 length:1122 start_codon:yes stop_codon:yes gene_type:complete